MISVTTDDISFEIIVKALTNFVSKDKYEISKQCSNTYLISEKSLLREGYLEIILYNREEGDESILIGDGRHPSIDISLTKPEFNTLKRLFDKLNDKFESNLKDHYLNLLKDE